MKPFSRLPELYRVLHSIEASQRPPNFKSTEYSNVHIFIYILSYRFHRLEEKISLQLRIIPLSSEE